MSNEVILAIGDLHPKLTENLKANYEVFNLADYDDPKSLLNEKGDAVTAVVTTNNYGFKKDLLEYLPNLKVVCSFGVGYDSVDIDALKEKGIQFSNTPEVLNDCVADTAISLWLAAVRQVPQANAFTKSGQWEKENYPLTPSVSNKKVGILGLGSIGKVVAKRCEAFDCEIRYHNRSQRTDVDYGYMESAKALAEWCDFLFVVTVGGPSTRHLVNADVLKALGSKGYIINVARGSVIDEAALKQALQEGWIAGGGLDVFENEPNIDKELFKFEQLVLMPHVASATNETREQMADLTFNNLQGFINSGKLITPVI